MATSDPIRHTNHVVDILRGLSAVLVLVSHARNFVLNDFAEGGDQGPIKAAFYLSTGLGHYSVVIFFVLSGFLVSQSVVRTDWASARAAWDYFIARLSRLWVVLVPALVLTACWDQLAILLTDSAFYRGTMAYFHSGPQGVAHLDPTTFLQNLGFLQTLASPVYGSNTPLWSLACEFWYYVAFPIVFLVSKPFGRAGFLVVTLVAVASLFLGVKYDLVVLKLFPAWIFGYLAAICRTYPLGKRASLSLLMASAVVLFISLVLTRTKWIADVYLDLIEAGGVAAFVTATRGFQLEGFYRKLVTIFSNISYSLYLTHFPFLAFLSATLLENRRYSFGADGLTILVCLTAACLLQAAVFYFCFERHTGYVRRVFSLSNSHRERVRVRTHGEALKYNQQ